MKFEIRKATKSDFNSVNQLFNELHEHEHEQFGRLLNLRWTNSDPGQNFIKKHFEDKNSAVFVAVCEQAIVGYVFGGRVRTTRPWKPVKQFLLANIYVHEDFRSAGIGASLIEAFVSWAKQNGAERIKLSAFTRNKSAIALYKKHGFKDSVSILTLDI